MDHDETNLSIDELYLNIHNVRFSSLVCQTDIKSDEDKNFYRCKGYDICLSETEFRDKFEIDPSCVWYIPSITNSSLYFNRETFAAAPLHIDFYTSGIVSGFDQLYKALACREREVENNDFRGSVLALPDGMRMEYFKFLVAKKGAKIPGLYDLFFSSYVASDYGFGTIDPLTLKAILSSKTAEDHMRTAEQLKELPDTLLIYRGGNTASTPATEAYSWSLDINVANFFACRRGIGHGYIAEAKVSKEKIIDAFLTDGHNESEVIVDPKDITLLREIPIHGLEFIGPILPQIAPMYHKFLDQMKQLDFVQESSIHGHAHEARVLLHALTISHLLGLSIRDQKILATAAIFHDTQRTTDDKDPMHGKASREYYHAYSKSPDPLVEFLCEYHCLPDAKGYNEIQNNRKLSKTRSRSNLLFDVFKDADALDRVRFGLRDIDINQLRLSVSKELSLVSRLYLKYVKVPETKKQKKVSLSAQIHSAETRKKRTAYSSSPKEKNKEPTL